MQTRMGMLTLVILHIQDYIGAKPGRFLSIVAWNVNMKLLRIIMSGLAWLSLILIAILLFMVFKKWSTNIWQLLFPSPGLIDESGIYIFNISIIFYILILVTTIISFVIKPPYVWIGMLIAGIFHIGVFSAAYKLIYYGQFDYFGEPYFYAIYLAPGYILFCLGFLLRKGKKNATRRAIN